MNSKSASSAPSTLCWCGSDKPYRDCHLDRDKQTPLQWHEIANEFKRQFSKKFCMHPEMSPSVCSRTIVEAHSVSRSSNLNNIAEDGHVMQFSFSLKHMIPNMGRLTAQRIGVRLASTFTGFCHHHDSSTFAPIDQPIASLSDAHIFLLAYRAICREFFAKKAEMELTRTARALDKGKDKCAQVAIQEFNHYRALGVQAGLSDLIAKKGEYDRALVGRNYDAISHYVIEFDHALPMACTIGFTPEVDFNGNRLQTLHAGTKHADLLTCSITKTTQGSAIIFAWLKEPNGACTRLINSLDELKLHLLPSAIVRLIFEHGENVFFSQTWWNGLAEDEQRIIESRANSFHHKPINCLADDGRRPVLWSIVSRKKVIRSH